MPPNMRFGGTGVMGPAKSSRFLEIALLAPESKITGKHVDTETGLIVVVVMA